MNNMDSNALSGILSIVLGVAFVILIILIVVLIILKFRDSKQKKDVNQKNDMIGNDKNNGIDKNKTTGEYKQYNKQSIFDFMEFDKIEDNMIVQKNGRKFLMVIECQGINYDLMSRVEKVGVEEGFQQFLNTLRHPIQIYIQTRTINLEESISTYKVKIKEIEDKYNQMLFRYNQMRESNAYTPADLDEYWFELTKQRNLLEYGKDIVSNTEKMSLNRNILNKKYFIIISYFAEENTEKYDKDEIRNIAFSDLYTNAQAIIRTLSSCSVSGKILTSKELVDLLYVAYNRDDSEVFGIDKAMMAGYEDLYSTSVDVYEKKVRALDELIHDRAIDLANETIEKVKSRPERIAKEKEDNLDELIRKMAELVIKENQSHVGQDIAEEAIKEIENDEGGNANEKVQKKTTRTRNAKTVNE
mgnify:CR=1 FL=1